MSFSLSLALGVVWYLGKSQEIKPEIAIIKCWAVATINILTAMFILNIPPLSLSVLKMHHAAISSNRVSFIFSSTVVIFLFFFLAEVDHTQQSTNHSFSESIFP